VAYYSRPIIISCYHIYRSKPVFIPDSSPFSLLVDMIPAKVRIHSGVMISMRMNRLIQVVGLQYERSTTISDRRKTNLPSKKVLLQQIDIYVFRVLFCAFHTFRTDSEFSSVELIVIYEELNC
jgi:hypothetical protein